MNIAHGDHFRRMTRLERLGERLRAPLARFPMRTRLRAAFHRLLLLATGGRGLTAVLPDGEVVRILPEYRYVTWNEEEYRAFKRALRPGATALDIGANVGCYSVLLGRLVVPGGRVFAFEPSPAAYEGLVRHISLNQLEGTVIPIRAAVADREGTATLIVSGSTGSDRLAAIGEPEQGTRQEVSLTTIDHFCGAQGIRPDLIKVDVEGTELAVLQGARGTIEAAGGALALFVEMHPTIWPSLSVSKAAMAAELERQHLRIEALSAMEDVWGVEGKCVRILSDDDC